MDIKTRRRGSVVIAEVTGELETEGLPDFAAAVDPMLAAGDVHWVLDLAGLRFVGSSALGALIEMSKQAKVAGGEVVVARPSSFVARVLMTLGLSVALRCFPSVEAAVEHFGRGSP